ncbi:zonadhesin-like isoform X3 [Anticarsia gemmatalis]|uniref:zonadhesin-like isoform X3 n=1 Tax=Anticarsia gemmatalis TaxID=129554 RepID=UPI003F75A4BB
MAFRTVILIALAASVFVVTCAADDPEASTSSSASSSSSDGSSSATATSSAQSKSKPGKKKCTRVKKCPRNEEFSFCTKSIGRAQYCSQKGQALSYQEDNYSCKEGCVCKEGYLRNDKGICVADRECKPKCGANEQLDECPIDCPSDYCPTSNEDTPACFKSDDYECPEPVCKCTFNHRRAENGTCIPTKECPAFDCSQNPNEEFNPCPFYCPTDDCSQASPTGECPKLFGHLPVLECQPQCRCIKGFWRKDGICVPYAECPNICPSNEEYVPCVQGVCRPLNCSQIGEEMCCPDPDCLEECDPGCVCKENYYRNDDGDCVTEEECEPPKCGDNEILDDCPVDCPADYCPNSAEDNEKCPKPDVCPPPQCKCAFNYRRAENGTCIPTEQCPPFDCSANPNEEYTPCPPICPSDDCSLPRLTGRCPFRIGIRLECNPKCQCKEGFGRVNGVCTDFNECPDLCPENEQYYFCTDALCRNQKCNQRGLPVGCPSVAYCTKGCVCKDGFYRNRNGTCVAEDQCEPDYCPDNEVYSNCTEALCRAQNCTNRYDPVACPSVSSCTPGCVCEPGYYRNQYGICISNEMCDGDVCSYNEKYTNCTEAVCEPQNCKDRNAPPACPSVSSCSRGCVCQSGFYRNEEGFCVTDDECKAEALCPNLHEEYTSSLIPNCPVLGTCKSVFAIIDCDEPEVTACVCKPGFLRLNETSPCVSSCECPEFAGHSSCQ